MFRKFIEKGIQPKPPKEGIMASDFYTFVGKIGPHRVWIEFYSRQPDADSMSSAQIKGRRPWTRAKEANDFMRERLKEFIRKGEFTLEYRGGWCPSGYGWGPNDEETWNAF